MRINNTQARGSVGHPIWVDVMVHLSQEWNLYTNNSPFTNFTTLTPHSVSFWNLNFELWTLNNFNGTVSFISLTGLAEQVWRTRQSPDQCFDWDDVADPSLVGEKHISPTDFCPHKLRSPSIRELRRPADCERSGHTFFTGIAWNKIQSNKILTGFRMPVLCPVPRVFLIHMDTMCDCEASSVTMQRL